MPLPHFSSTPRSPLRSNDFDISFIYDDASYSNINCGYLDLQLSEIKIEWIPDNLDIKPSVENLKKIKNIYLRISDTYQLFDIELNNYKIILNYGTTDLMQVNLIFIIKNTTTCHDADIKSVIRNMKLDKLI